MGWLHPRGRQNKYMLSSRGPLAQPLFEEEYVQEDNSIIINAQAEIKQELNRK